MGYHSYVRVCATVRARACVCVTIIKSLAKWTTTREHMPQSTAVVEEKIAAEPDRGDICATVSAPHPLPVIPSRFRSVYSNNSSLYSV